ncbi:hypothetical protein BC835DRAFT_754838 [Cytidiella melzeri]|nr:hypothetical protein BC835DRAFT_754838 [Cytidiella melzeri]
MSFVRRMALKFEGKDKTKKTGLSLSDLPQELIDVIIDVFHNDKKMLHACSLIGPAWRSRSQHHLLSQITVGPQRKPTDPIRPLISHLRESPHFSARFHELTLTGDMSDMLSVSARWLTAILENLPNLKILRLRLVDFTSLDRFFSPSTRFNLEHLQLVDTGVNSEEATIENTLEILELFDSLGRLSIQTAYARVRSYLEFDTVLADFAAKVPKHLHVNALQVQDYFYATSFWLALMRRTALQSFTSLDVGSRKWDPNALHSLLQEAGAGLRHLDINLECVHSSDADSLGEKLGLFYCANLKEFAVRLHKGFGHTRGVPTWSQLCHLLSSIEARLTLRHLTIIYPMEGVMSNGDTEWDKMVRVLQKFTVLDRLVFDDPGMSPERKGVVQEAVRQHLGGLSEQLRICLC